jgi:RNA recognition motif-containing protein
MVNIFIANLDWEITSEDLKTTFSAFGPVNYAHVVYEKETKRSKGFGYVEMEETDHAINAIDALNGMEINGRKLDVKIASPKGNRPPKKEVVKKPFEKKPFEKKPFRSENRFEGKSGERFSRN